MTFLFDIYSWHLYLTFIFVVHVWRFHLTSIFDVCMRHLYFTFMFDIYVWHLYLKLIFENYIWNLYLTFTCNFAKSMITLIPGYSGICLMNVALRQIRVVFWSSTSNPGQMFDGDFAKSIIILIPGFWETCLRNVALLLLIVFVEALHLILRFWRTGLRVVKNVWGGVKISTVEPGKSTAATSRNRLSP